MLNNSLTHVSTQTAPLSFPAVPRRHAEQLPPLVRSRQRQPLPPMKSAATLAVNNKLTGGGKGMSWFYELEQEVREYELDQIGLVNHATLSNFCEYGTYKLLDKIGFDAHIKLAISEVKINYLSPLKRKDKYLLKLRLYDYSATRFYFEDQVLRLPDYKPVLWAAATLVLLDEKLRPARITPVMISQFNKFLQTHTNN